VTAKPVGIEALVVAARAAGYAMVPDNDTETEIAATLDEQSVAETTPPGRALTILTQQRASAHSVTQVVSAWMRDHLPSIGWRAPA
jgi:hypothetical protein